MTFSNKEGFDGVLDRIVKIIVILAFLSGILYAGFRGEVHIGNKDIHLDRADRDRLIRIEEQVNALNKRFEKLEKQMERK